jgi:hypothetical protein
MMFGTAGRGVWHLAQRRMFWWYHAKMFIEHASIVTSDALHVLIGVALWVIAAVVLRRRLTEWLPWLVVLVAVLFNEAVDLWVEQWPDAAMQYGESARDILLTLLLPTLLMAAARERPDLFAGRRVSRSPGEADGRTRRP